MIDKEIELTAHLRELSPVTVCNLRFSEAKAELGYAYQNLIHGIVLLKCAYLFKAIDIFTCQRRKECSNGRGNICTSSNCFVRGCPRVTI